MTELRATCVSTNVAVHSLHRRTGFKEVGIIRAAQNIGGWPVDLIQFLVTPADWAGVRERIVPLAQVAGIQVREWEKTQTAGNQPWLETKIRN
jgi:hypothetical protein